MILSAIWRHSDSSSYPWEPSVATMFPLTTRRQAHLPSERVYRTRSMDFAPLRLAMLKTVLVGMDSSVWTNASVSEIRSGQRVVQVIPWPAQTGVSSWLKSPLRSACLGVGLVAGPVESVHGFSSAAEELRTQ